MKNKNIVLLLIFLFVIFSSFQANDLVSINEEKDLENTNKISAILEKIVQKVLRISGGFVEKFTQNNNKNNEINNNNDKKPKLFQGDVVLSSQEGEEILNQVVENVENAGIDVSEIIGETERRKKRKMSGNMTLAWDFPILYIVEEGVNDTLVDVALKKMEEQTCITFRREFALVPNKAGLRFFKGTGCYSYIGRKFLDIFQDVSIGEGCETIGTIQHETMHALGVYHEQARADRDKYLQIFLNNVEKGNEFNFLKVEPNSSFIYNTKYDYGSAMQYPSTAFSMNNSVTMLPIKPHYNKTLGVNSGMTFVDVKLLNNHYCKNNCSKKITCENKGYQSSMNCSKCICPDGYFGDYCTELPQKKPSCGDPVIEITKRKKYLYTAGSGNCIHHLNTTSDKKLKITFTFLNYYPGYEGRCKLENSLEVKYLKDKTVTGALFCLKDNATIISRNNHVIVHHRSTQTNNGATLVIESIEDSNTTSTKKN
uniref:Zinc metalloproteinase n=1 Tax=Strongyloides papillosus TaxID=174720 RepID=A0A0N5C1B8_STREA